MGWAETPCSWGTRRQRRKQGRDGRHVGNVGPQRRRGRLLPACSPTCPCTQLAGGWCLLPAGPSPALTLAPLQSQGRALMAGAEPWAGAHRCLEAAPVSSWQSQAAGGGECAGGGQGQPAVSSGRLSGRRKAASCGQSRGGGAQRAGLAPPASNSPPRNGGSVPRKLRRRCRSQQEAGTIVPCCRAAQPPSLMENRKLNAAASQPELVLASLPQASFPIYSLNI